MRCKVAFPVPISTVADCCPVSSQHGFGFGEGPGLNQDEVDGILKWGPSCVRVGINQGCFLGETIPGFNNSQYIGKPYVERITKWVDLLLANGLVVIVDLHWSSGGWVSLGQVRLYFLLSALETLTMRLTPYSKLCQIRAPLLSGRIWRPSLISPASSSICTMSHIPSLGLAGEMAGTLASMKTKVN